MKLKKQFVDKIITRKINGRKITFDTRNTDDSKNKFYSEVGFRDVFESTPESTPVKKKKKKEIVEVKPYIGIEDEEVTGSTASNV